MFPGQGTQAIGMGAGLFERFPLLVEEADDVLGYSCRLLCLADPDGRLRRTRYAQSAIYVCNALHLAARQQGGEQADWCVGHSLGEYSALLAAGAFDFGTGLRLVERRGELFEQCGEGTGMAAVVGLSQARIRTVLREEDLTRLYLANLISGPLDALEAARAPLQSAGCVLYRMLDVRGAFHSPWLTPVKPLFEQTLGATSFNALALPVVSNTTARPMDGTRLTGYLREQIDHPVRWAESLRYLQREGVRQFDEVGHGKVLSGLYRALQRESRNLRV
jgi:[acyl-carrier-protein] S-malonyltransferase